MCIRDSLQQPVIATEVHESGERIIEHLPDRAGPDRRSHRQQIPLGEGSRICSGGKKVTEGELFVRMRRQPGHALAVEAQDIGQHAPEIGAYQIALLTENGGQAASRPLDIRLFEADGKRHFGFHATYAEMGKQSRQIRIGRCVIDQETGVNRMRKAIDRYIDGVGMPTETVFRLVKRCLLYTSRCV